MEEDKDGTLGTVRIVCGDDWRVKVTQELNWVV